MARRSADAVYRKWASNMQNAGQSMIEGAQSVTVSPTQKAADAEDKWEAGVRRARQDGTFRSALQSVSLSDWQQAYIKKGVPRVTDGVKAAQPKMTKFLGELLVYTENVKQQIASMPSNTPEERKQRMLRNYELMSAFRSSRRGG